MALLLVWNVLIGKRNVKHLLCKMMVWKILSLRVKRKLYFNQSNDVAKSYLILSPKSYYLDIDINISLPSKICIFFNVV